ncbi:MAG: MBL fold metallo-hydrolase [Dehalococcoidia bacterium]|nr:MBL fold metallo-hydrolase [Dehalococcoidia bacterium]
MEIAPGVHRIEGINGSNSVLLVDEQMAVVETGVPGNGDTIVKYIRNLGRSPRDLRWIVVTHFHFDHSGSDHELHELTGARVVAHRDETASGPGGHLVLRKGIENQDNQAPFWYRWVMKGGVRRRVAMEYHNTEVQETVQDGDIIPVLGGLRVIHTPGHTPGSLSLLLQKPQVLFLGDTAINNVNRVSRPLMWDRNKRRQLDGSLRSLRELQAEIACFGHGPPLTDAPMNKIRALTNRPYDLPTWRIALKNWRTLSRWQASTRRPGHWGPPG